jgi:enoyl-CoA hydratase
MSDEPVRYERVGAAAVLTIDRPGRRNAVDGATAEALFAGYRAFEADADARVLVLTGAGGTFCAGADLLDLASLAPRVYLPEGPMGFTRLTPSKPTIAAVEGWAAAGGFELALWCDLRVMGRSARFGFLERRWGVPLIDGGTQRLPRIVGLGRALDLILSGRPVEPEEARAIGLATEVVEDGAVLGRALELAETIAGFPQDTMLADRASAYAGLGLPLEHGLWAEARAGVTTLATGLAGAQRFAAGQGRGGARPEQH